MPLDTFPLITLPLFAVLGVACGSFANVLIERLPAGHSILGRSICDRCKRVLRFVEMLPVISYLMQRGKCRSCAADIPSTFALIELLGGALFVLALFLAELQVIPGILLALTFLTLLVIAIIDARTQTIPDVLTIALTGCAVLLQLVHGQFLWTGATLGVAFIGAQWLISRGKWVGSGDVLLVAALGILLGDHLDMAIALMLAYGIGALWAAAVLLWKSKKEMHVVAFGPFLILGSVIALVWGEQIRMMVWGM